MTLPLIESCDGCGACCIEMCSPPFLGPEDPEYWELPAELRDDYDRGMNQRDADGWPDGVPCFWLDQTTKKCRHYEYRPDICRNGLQRNDEACLAWREQYGPKFS